MRVKIFIAAATLSACAQGIDPPEATNVRAIAGGEVTLGMSNFDPCENSRVDNNAPIIDCSAATQSELVRAVATVGNFCMDEHEVTIDQYRHCVARGECDKPESTNAGNRGDGFIEKYYGDAGKYGSFPVLGVSWTEANSYCAFREGRLPTEIEWEFAATSRGQREQVFEDADVVADIAADCGGNKDKVAFGACSGRQVREVGTSSADKTAQGIFDLAGNAQEWVADEFDYFAYCADPQPDGATLSSLYVVNGERPEPQASSTWPLPMLTGAVDACLDTTGADDNKYSGLCNDQATRCLTVCVEAWDNNNQTSQKQTTWQRFDCEARFAASNCDCAAIGDESCQAQCDCIDAPRAAAASDSKCIGACFDDYAECAAGCTEDDVFTACIKDGRESRPRPICQARTFTAVESATPHKTPAGLTSDTIKGRHVARGAAFQDTEACELRPSRRVAKNISSPLVGFRCVYDQGTGPCR